MRRGTHSPEWIIAARVQNHQHLASLCLLELCLGLIERDCPCCGLHLISRRKLDWHEVVYRIDLKAVASIEEQSDIARSQIPGELFDRPLHVDLIRISQNLRLEAETAKGRAQIGGVVDRVPQSGPLVALIPDQKRLPHGGLRARGGNHGNIAGLASRLATRSLASRSHGEEQKEREKDDRSRHM